MQVHERGCRTRLEDTETRTLRQQQRDSTFQDNCCYRHINNFVSGCLDHIHDHHQFCPVDCLFGV